MTDSFVMVRSPAKMLAAVILDVRTITDVKVADVYTVTHYVMGIRVTDAKKTMGGRQE